MRKRLSLSHPKVIKAKLGKDKKVQNFQNTEGVND